MSRQQPTPWVVQLGNAGPVLVVSPFVHEAVFGSQQNLALHTQIPMQDTGCLLYFSCIHMNLLIHSNI